MLLMQSRNKRCVVENDAMQEIFDQSPAGESDAIDEPPR